MTTVRDLMTADPATAEPDTTLDRVATAMRDHDTGFVPVVEEGKVTGALTDRDIVIRAVADGRAPEEVRAGDIATTGLITVAPDDDASAAASRMREAGVRRVAVVEGDELVGVLAIGDLAIELDSDSALADISADSPDA